MRAAWYGAVLLVGSVAAGAFAHTDVENPAVLARMDNMKAMADQMEVLVPMARGAADLEPQRITEALDALQQSAAEVPRLFRVPEMDPQSEALPDIWENLDDFVGRSEELLEIAGDASGSQFNDRQDLLQLVREIGSSCSGCHEEYRIAQ